ncbi:trypsin-like peptidase domain-containing protein [Pseudobacteriovorax antillogorgiicola]|uniref:Serine protease n=1 Tax=Pseudobacteriovorax antillogorgiicola TaxID=1513793 RepID=A0A1Y6CJN0_9BACT|nr:trypsin-like peptidase domain-containing protein [Pseudobacteriovorax antillogorgiicola]TCS46426.1 V8-like Glu-specific endopeptidase [Pseudobacteriovorax antillogorgiicola]SMF69018.1 V8-like Glu-specific endopeptidase [Pseudobacteriovorax antillogorgiicola]
MSFAIIICLSVIFMTGCGESTSTSRLDTIFDELEGEFVTPESEDPFSRRVGVLWHHFPEFETSLPFCSAVLIKDDLVATNSHCIPADISSIYFDLEFRSLRAKIDDNIDEFPSKFNTMTYKGELSRKSFVPEYGFHFKEVLLNDKDVDMALVRISVTGRPGLLDSANGGEFKGGDVVLYSHFQGMPLFKSTNCTSWKKGKILYHDCDSSSGSSGGLLVSADSNEFVGLHRQGPVRNNSETAFERKRYESREEVFEMLCGDNCGQQEFYKAGNRAIPASDLIRAISDEK